MGRRVRSNPGLYNKYWNKNNTLAGSGLEAHRYPGQTGDRFLQRLGPPPAAGHVRVDWDITPFSDARLRNMGRFASMMDESVRARAMALNAEITRDLEETIKYNFSTHEDTGGTIGTLRASYAGFGGTVTIAGAAEFIEYGTPPHDIEPLNGRALVFAGESGDVQFASHVYHPGVSADPFIERSMDQVDVIGRMQTVVSQAYTSIHVVPGNEYI